MQTDYTGVGAMLVESRELRMPQLTVRCHKCTGRLMLRVYGYPASINVRKVLWVCAELQLAVENLSAPPLPSGLSPVGLVPVLDDDGVIVWESNVIVRYLAATRDRRDLLPTDWADRANIEKWMDWQASDFNNSWRYAFQALVRRREAFGDAALTQQSVEAFNHCVGVIDLHLAAYGPYIAGRQFTVADIAIGLSVHRWRSIPMTRPVLPNVQRYYDRLCQREAFQRYGKDGGP